MQTKDYCIKFDTQFPEELKIPGNDYASVKLSLNYNLFDCVKTFFKKYYENNNVGKTCHLLKGVENCVNLCYENNTNICISDNETILEQFEKELKQYNYHNDRIFIIKFTQNAKYLHCDGHVFVANGLDILFNIHKQILETGIKLTSKIEINKIFYNLENYDDDGITIGHKTLLSILQNRKKQQATDDNFIHKLCDSENLK